MKQRLNGIIEAVNVRREVRGIDGDETIAERVAWRRREKPNTPLSQTSHKTLGKKKKDTNTIKRQCYL